jgi:hypothetical protein
MFKSSEWRTLLITSLLFTEVQNKFPVDSQSLSASFTVDADNAQES